MASTRTSTYSPIDVSVVISHPATGMIHTIAGYSDDSFINIARDSETYDHYTGIDNQATRIYKANTSAKITVTLAQSSASNDILTELYRYDKASRNSKGLFSVLVKDGSGRAYAFAQEGYIGKVPDSGYGAGMSTREWVLHVTQLDDYIAGNGLVSAQDKAAIEQMGGSIADEWLA